MSILFQLTGLARSLDKGLTKGFFTNGLSEGALYSQFYSEIALLAPLNGVQFVWCVQGWATKTT